MNVIEDHKSLRTRHRIDLDSSADLPIESFSPVVDVWFTLKANGPELPEFSSFDILMLPPSSWSKLLLVKTVGERRRFFYELIGQDIEKHNGFPGQKRFLFELPLKNKRVMAREFVHSLKVGMPVFSTGPYIGQADYVKTVSRIICPYRLGEDQYAFVGMASFEDKDGLSLMEPNRCGPALP